MRAVTSLVRGLTVAAFMLAVLGCNVPRSAQESSAEEQFRRDVIERLDRIDQRLGALEAGDRTSDERAAGDDVRRELDAIAAELAELRERLSQPAPQERGAPPARSDWEGVKREVGDVIDRLDAAITRLSERLRRALRDETGQDAPERAPEPAPPGQAPAPNKPLVEPVV